MFIFFFSSHIFCHDIKERLRDSAVEVRSAKKERALHPLHNISSLFKISTLGHTSSLLSYLCQHREAMLLPSYNIV